MNVEKVLFSFFILLAATLNFGFVYGDIDNPAHHDQFEFFAAIIVNLIATVLKFGDRTHIGADRGFCMGESPRATELLGRFLRPTAVMAA